MILADSAVWIDHLRTPNMRFAAALNDKLIVGHPFVTGEVALGSLADRARIIWRMERLDQLSVARPELVLALVENHRLYGVGIGYVDAHLLASVRMSEGASLWTRDRRLHAQAERLGVAAKL